MNGRKPHNLYFPGQEITKMRITIRRETAAKYAFLAQMSGRQLFQIFDEAMEIAYSPLLKAVEDKQNLLLKQMVFNGQMPVKELSAINAGEARVIKAEAIVSQVKESIDSLNIPDIDGILDDIK
jgi:hypothetical protein